MNAEERIDDLIVDVIGSTHGADENVYPVVGVVAYDQHGEQQFGRTAVMPDMPDSALEAVMSTILWNFIEVMDLTWEEAAALVADILAKAQYTFEQEAPEEEAELIPQVTPIETLTTSFEIAAGSFLEQLHRMSPGMKPVAAAVWHDHDTGFATAAAGPDITIEEWAAMLKTLLGPAVREGQISEGELRAILDEVFAGIVLEPKRPKPLLS